MTAAFTPGRTRRGLLITGTADWLIAFSLVVTGTARSVAVPLLAAAAGLLACLHGRPVIVALRAPSTGISRWAALEHQLGTSWSPRTARLVLHEPRLLWSVLLLLLRRRDGDPKAMHGSAAEALPTWLLLLGVCLVEIVVTALLPLPHVVGLVLLLLGVWGCLVVAGLFAALLVHPHLVEDRVVRLRSGFWDEVVIDRATVASARRTPRSPAPRGLTARAGTASLSPTGETNVLVMLSQPAEVRGELVNEVRCWADDPDGLARACCREG